MISTVVTSSVLILVVIALRAIFRGKVSSRIQYALWGLVLLRALLPFSLFASPVSIMNAVNPAAVASGVWESFASNTENLSGAKAVANTSNTYFQDAADREAANSYNKTALDRTPGNKPDGTEKKLTAAARAVWLWGMAVVSLWFILINIRFYLKLRKLRKPFAAPDCRLPVYVADQLPSPCLFGLFRPGIYLTPKAVKDEETVRHVLAHELTHYSHRDHLWTFLRSMALIIHWFNPLMWMGANLSKTDCELACDEATIKKLGEESRIQYGRTLVDLISINSKPSDLICASTTMTFGKSEMKKRIVRIAGKPKTFIFALLAVGIIMAAAVSCTYTGAAGSDGNTGSADSGAAGRTAAGKTAVNSGGGDKDNEIVNASAGNESPGNSIADRSTVDSEAESTDNAGAENGQKTPEDILLEKLKALLTSGSTIEYSCTDDFNSDGNKEMFALVNAVRQNETDLSGGGQVWYVDNGTAKMLLECGYYPDSTKVWEVGRQKLFHVEEGYGGSDTLSHVWSVKDGKPYELKSAGEMLQYAGNLQFYTYPGAFDLLSDGTGHTWKPYYLYFDEATGTLKEYGGISISKKDLLKLKGTSDILDQLNKKGCKITDIFYRQNGIININYKDGDYNLNLTLTVENGSAAIEGQGSVENPNLDIGGIYKAAAFEDIATYPEKFDD